MSTFDNITIKINQIKSKYKIAVLIKKIWKRSAINPQQIWIALVHTRLLHCLKIKISSETQFSLYIAEVLLDIFLSVARIQKMTVKRSLLKIASLITESFRGSYRIVYTNLSLFFFRFESILNYYCCYRFSFSKHAYWLLRLRLL